MYLHKWTSSDYLPNGMQRLWKGVEVMKFKIGDKVRVREDLEKRVVEMPSGFSIVITGEMIDLTDEVVTISSVGKETYKVEELKYYEWTDEMFEPIDDPLTKKIEERNNKLVKTISDENLLNDNDPIKPAHYRKGEIDLYESWYRTYPLNEFRAGMQMIAERYMKRDKENRIEDLDKAIYTLTRLKEYEEQNK